MADGLILASRSPQRRAILEQLGVDFVVQKPEVEELTSGEPRALVLENARRKAAAVARARGIGGAAASATGGAAPMPPDRGATAEEHVLGVDTAVVLGQRVYGKPRDAAEAARFLGELSAVEHEVMSGLVLLDRQGERADVAVTRVRFRALSPGDVKRYVDCGEWRERAGGYAIQGRGATLVEEIHGDYWNVVGLPVAALVRLAPELVR